MATAILKNNGPTNYSVGEPNYNPHSYRCHLAIVKDEEGGYSVIVLNLPGVGSCGDSEEEAVSNAKEAAVEAIASYLADGEEIPWASCCNYEIPEGSRLKWVLVDA